MWKEVTDISGIAPGRSWGAAWGDFNGDDYPDLWINYHNDLPILYLNERNGTFSDITTEVFLKQPKGDQHGVAWADFDNDGDRDLVQIVGGRSGVGTGPELANRLYINEEGKLSERASSLGVDYPLARGRNPLWLDFNNDGKLDLFVGAIARTDGNEAPPKIFQQANRTFEDVSASKGFNLSGSSYALLSDLSGDGNLDLVARNSGSPRFMVYDTTSTPFTNITSGTIPNAIRAEDVASADFNGDLRPDLYLTASTNSSDLYQDESDSFRARLIVNSNEQGVEFNTTGDVTFQFIIPGASVDPNQIYIGAQGFHPDGSQFTLSPEDPQVEGIFSHTPGSDRGIYISYNRSQQNWELRLSAPNRTDLITLIEATKTIEQLTAIGFQADPPPVDDQLLLYTDEGFVDRSKEAGINNIPIRGRSVVAGDYDNDMDVDLYVVTSRSVFNTSNILYQNQGDGTFIAIAGGGGAAGTSLGDGDSVAMADYDLDGFLDLLVMNGRGPRTPLVNDAPYQLFRNQGNENHWLQIDLEGITSNRDGIGAQVFATAGGITQLREQSGGVHNQSQNHQRLHFGLAGNDVVDELLIKWPSGVEQKIENIPADQIIRIIEPSGSFIPGQPEYQTGEEAGVFIWQEFFDGPYHLRTVGAGDSTEFGINLIANDNLLEVTPVNLEASDVFEGKEFGFSLTSKLGTWEDGVDFRLRPGAKAILSVTQDGVANPRQVNVGKQRARLAPVGWIVSSDEFPNRPAFTPGKDLGLFVGKGTNENTLEFRWNGDGKTHETVLSVLAADKTPQFVPVNLEQNDQRKIFSNGIEIQGPVGTWYDGLDVTTVEPTKIAVTYEQDGLIQPSRVNPFDNLLGLPNAYQVPLADPYGQPEYDPSVEEGIFIWKGEQDYWHLRVTGSNMGSRYVGSIISDQAPIDIREVSIEQSDVVNTSDPLRIDFELQVWNPWEDGLDILFPTGASITLNLEGPSEDTTALLRVGEEKWAVSELPLNLSDW